MRLIRNILISLYLLCGLAVAQEAYGISSIYQDTRTKQMLYDFSMYQPIKYDSVLIEWTSYSYYTNKELLSKQWVNYWFTPQLAVGTEIELWYTWNRDYIGTEWNTKTLYVTPRLGIQIRWW